MPASRQSKSAYQGLLNMILGNKSVNAIRYYSGLTNILMNDYWCKNTNTHPVCVARTRRGAAAGELIFRSKHGKSASHSFACVSRKIKSGEALCRVLISLVLSSSRKKERERQ